MALKVLAIVAVGLSGAAQAQQSQPMPVVPIVAPPPPPPMPVVPVVAPPPVAVGEPAPVFERLASLVVPDGNAEAAIDRLSAALLQSMTARDADFADAVARYPGLDDAVSTAMRPLLLEGTRMATPMYRADLARFYASRLSPQEAGQFADFLAKPGPRKFFDTARAQNSYKAISSNLADEKAATADAVRRDITNAGQKAAEVLTEAEKAEVMLFFGSPLGLKLRSFGADKTALDLKWFNYAPPELETRIGQAVLRAMIDHVAKTDRKTADSMRRILKDDLAD
jgi:hypothetical protein